MPRRVVSPEEIVNALSFEKDSYALEEMDELYANLALPSYVHGYSLGIEYMYNWFRSKFDPKFFVGGIYIDGKHVLDDYSRLNEYHMKNIIKGQNPRARIAPRVQFDYDRDGLDFYAAPPEVYLRRSAFQGSFFRDYDRGLFLGYVPRGMRMDFDFKVRVNSRSQQLDTYNKMELNFRNGATQAEYISADYHVPKYIILDIADKAGFEIYNGEVLNTIGFLEYLNRHSDLTFLFKLRAINMQPEYFIRQPNIYTHIAVRDKLQLDDGERDGKLDFNFHIEMNAVLDMPIPHYYAYYSAHTIKEDIMVKELDDAVAVYTINVYEIPKVDKHGWMQGAYTDYQAEDGDTYIDFAPIFRGDNPLSRAINHDYTAGVSPSRFINIEVYRDEAIAKRVNCSIDWSTQRLIFEHPEDKGILHIVIYYDREYVNELESTRLKMKETRISKDEEKINPKK